MNLMTLMVCVFFFSFCHLHLSTTCQWCALYSDGNPLLISCDECGAANCGACVPQLAEVSSRDLASYRYVCVGCAGRKGVFQVCLNFILYIKDLHSHVCVGAS